MFGILQKRDRGELLIASLQQFVRKGNWSHDSFDKLDVLLSQVGYEMQQGTITKSDVSEITTNFRKDFLAETLENHMVTQVISY